MSKIPKGIPTPHTSKFTIYQGRDTKCNSWLLETILQNLEVMG
jgi:hypothetical protein